MRLPRSLLFFVATGAAYLLQMFPVPGIILMLMLAPFWSVLLVNAGMIGVGVEASSGSVSRSWLLLPVLWFGSYGAQTVSDHLALWRLQGQIARANGGVRVPFDPAAEALVFAKDDAAGWLVENSALPVAYVRNANYPGSTHLATRMVDISVCDKVRGEPGLSGAGIYTFGFHDDDAGIGGARIGRDRFETRFCELRQPEDPALPKVVIDTIEREYMAGSLPVTETVTTITTPDGHRYTLRGGVAAPLSWLPMPILGCGLNSGAPSWDCVQQFKRDSFVPLELTGPRYHQGPSALMQALGLARVAPADRHGVDPGDALQSVASARDRVVEGETAKLDQAIADISGEIGSVPFNSLRGRLDIILPRIDRIVTGVERGVEIKGNARSNAQQMFELLEQAPADDIAPYRARIDALQAKDSWFVFKPVPVGR